MRDEKEERKKQARLNKQTRQSNTAHPRQLEKKLPQVGHMYMYFSSAGRVPIAAARALTD